MTLYIATINTPGYLPQSDDVLRFETATDAWSCLASEREHAEDSFEPEEEEYSETREILLLLSDPRESTPETVDPATRCGTVYGPTPGYSGEHDLGLAYSVEVLEHVNYPHPEGYLYDCVACEHGPCMCSVNSKSLAPCASTECERSS